MTNGPISKIRIRNYQSLKKLDINLGNITVVTGESDSGKSALFCAVKAAVSNQAGDAFVTAGESKTVVAIDDVAWVQSSKDNSYQIKNRKWEKVGRGVPEDVSAELNMREFEFGKDVKLFLNFSGQLDRAFIVQGNPADNAKVIGSISNIHVIYNALREAEKDTKAIKRKISTIQEQSEQYEIQLQKDEPELERLDKLYDRMKSIFDRANFIDKTMSRIASVKARLITMPNEGQLRARSAQLGAVDFDRFERVFLSIGSARPRLAQLQSIRGKIRAVRLAQTAYKGINPETGTKTLAAYEALSGTRSRAKRLLGEIEATKNGIVEAVVLVEGIEEKMEAYDVCDVCGSERVHWNV